MKGERVLKGHKGQGLAVCGQSAPLLLPSLSPGPTHPHAKPPFNSETGNGAGVKWRHGRTAGRNGAGWLQTDVICIRKNRLSANAKVFLKSS